MSQNTNPGTAAARAFLNPPQPTTPPVVPFTPAPVVMTTLPKATFNIILGVAIGASALLVFLLGLFGSGGSLNHAASTSATLSPVAVVSTTPVTTSQRGPNATERAILAQAQAETKRACWAEWNDVQNGFEIICSAH